MAKQPEPGDRIGAIDCGSNAIRFSIYRLDDDLKPALIMARRYPVRLGAGTFANGRLAPGDIDAAVEAFQHIKALAEEHNVIALPAVATSAIRDAANAAELVSRLADHAGITLRPISGEEEADLTAAGVNATVETDNNRIIFDVGGGSTEVIRCRPNGDILDIASLPLGAVRFAQEAGLPDLYDDEDIVILRERIGQVLRERFFEGTNYGDFGIAIGGTARAIAHFAAGRGFITDERQLTLQGVVDSFHALIKLRPEDMVAGTGIDQSRAMIIVPGVLILLGVMAFQGLENAMVSDAGIREGLVSRYLSGSSY